MQQKRRQALRCVSDNFGNGTTPPIPVDRSPRSAPRRIGSRPQIDRSRYGASSSRVCIVRIGRFRPSAVPLRTSIAVRGVHVSRSGRNYRAAGRRVEQCASPVIICELAVAGTDRGSRPGAIYSMTRSACSSSEFGISILICFAACRLITRSNRIGSTAGRVAGSAPLAILSI